MTITSTDSLAPSRPGAAPDLLELPGVVEQVLVVAASFVLFNGLPPDWWRS